MKALLLSQYNQLDIADLPAPVPGADEILVRVAACGICGSDVHGYDGTSGRRIPPIVMGHEAAGVVAAAGTGVSKFKPGDRVTFDSTVYCGQCEFCLQGDINLCNNRQVIGVSCGDFRRAGAFAEYVVVPQRIAYHLPEALEFQEAAMLEAVSVALHGVRVSEMKGGETVLVIGAGMIGLLTLQAAKAAGASRVLVADIDRSRLETAEKLGADETLLLSGAELVQEILPPHGRQRRGPGSRSGGARRNHRRLHRQRAQRRNGHAHRQYLSRGQDPAAGCGLRQIRLQGSCASSGEYPQAMELMANGKIKVKPLITAVAPLSDGPAMVCPASRGRAKSDESRAGSWRIVHLINDKLTL